MSHLRYPRDFVLLVKAHYTEGSQGYSEDMIQSKCVLLEERNLDHEALETAKAVVTQEQIQHATLEGLRLWGLMSDHIQGRVLRRLAQLSREAGLTRQDGQPPVLLSEINRCVLALSPGEAERAFFQIWHAGFPQRTKGGEWIVVMEDDFLRKITIGYTPTR